MAWDVFERIYNGHYLLVGYSNRYFPKMLVEAGNPEKSTYVSVMENDVNPMVFDAVQFDRLGRFLSNRLINDHSWRKHMYERHDSVMKTYFRACERLRRLDYARMSNTEIARRIRPILRMQENVRVLGVLLNGLPLDGRNHLSDSIRSELRGFLKDDGDFEKHWSFLTQVTKPSMRQMKDLEIARLAAGASSMSAYGKMRRLERIFDRYSWLDYMYYGPPAGFAKYEQELKEAERDNKSLDILKRLKEISGKQDTLMKKLRFNPRARHLVRLSQSILWHKGWRKDVEYHGFFCYEPLFREIASRRGVGNFRTLLYLLPWEVDRYILGGKPSARKLEERRRFSVLVSNSGGVRILTGKPAKTFYKKLRLERDFSHLTEARGQCAYPGKARGRVRIIHVPADMSKMREGDVIVSQATSPDLIEAMRKASAIVTNTGGLICHAAITARELRIPCIVGTGNATNVFKDGDLVEVDAESGVIRLVKR